MQEPPSSVLPLHLLFPQRHDDFPRPPFSASFRDYLIVGLSWERRALRHLVPEELDLSDPVTGFIATGRAVSGWGVRPFSNFYLAIAVEGLSSPDGTPGHFRPVNLYSPHAARIFRHHYNVLMDDAAHLHQQEGDLHQAEIRGGGLHVRIAARAAAVPPAPTTGVHHYLGRDAMGEITSFHTSFTADFAPVEVEALEIGGPGADRLPMGRVQWATHFPRLDVTIGEPRGSPFAAVAGVPGAAQLTVLLSRIGLAAACLGEQGQVLSANAAARAVLRQLGPEVLMRLARADRPLALDRVQTGLPMIAQAMALDPSLLNQPASLVLFREPAGAGRGNAAAVLELLGLTPAEARIASAMSGGGTTATVATALGLAHSTVRSTLQVIYQKLGVRRQSELAQILVRLSDLSGPDNGGGPDERL